MDKRAARYRISPSWPTLLVVGLSTTFSPLPQASAEPEQMHLVDEKKLVEGSKPGTEGWDPRLTVGANFAMASSSNVVGQTDGVSLTFGGQADSGLSYVRSGHEWRNTLKLSLMGTRSAALAQLVKSNDVFELESIYLWHFKRVPWLGPFARFRLDTAMLPGRDVRADPVTYRINRADGTVDPDRPGVTGLSLTDAFQPLALRETLGVFAKPLEHKRATVEFKLGFQANQVLIFGEQLAIEDDDATDEIEVKELETALQGGPVAGVDLVGAMHQGKLTYYAGFEAMMPVLNNDAADRSAGDLINLLAQAGLSVKLFSWASLDYQFKLLREPQVLDAFQVQNNLLLTFSYAILEPAPKG